MKFKKIFIIVAFGLFGLSLSGSAVRAMESSGKNDGFAEKLNKIKSDSKLENVSQQSEETVHKALNVDKNEANKINETGKANDFEFNFEKPIELFGKNCGDVFLNGKHVSDEQEYIKELKKIKAGNIVVDVEVNKTGKINDSEFNFEKLRELFGNDRGNVMLGRKHRLNEREVAKGVKLDKNKIIDLRFSDFEKEDDDNSKFKKPYESTSNVTFTDLANTYNLNLNTIRGLMFAMIDESKYGREFKNIFDNLQSSCPSTVNHYLELVKSFKSKDAKSFDEIKETESVFRSKVGELLKKDLIGCEKNEDENCKNTAFKPFGRLDKNLEIKEFDVSKSKIEALKSKFKEAKEFGYAKLNEFVSDLKFTIKLNKDTDKKLCFWDRSSTDILKDLDQHLNEYRQKLFADKFDSAKFEEEFNYLFGYISVLMERIEIYCGTIGVFDLWLDFNKKLKAVRKADYDKLEKFVLELKNELTNEVFDSGEDLFLKDGKKEIFSNKDEIIKKLDDCLIEYKKVLYGKKTKSELVHKNLSSESSKKKAEIISLFEAIYVAMEKLQACYVVKPVHVNSPSLKQKTSDCLKVLEKYFIAKLNCELIEIAIKERFGVDALENLSKTRVYIDC